MTLHGGWERTVWQRPARPSAYRVSSAGSVKHVETSKGELQDNNKVDKDEGSFFVEAFVHQHAVARGHILRSGEEENQGESKIDSESAARAEMSDRVVRAKDEAT